MQNIEPFWGWEKHYQAANDRRSPFYGQKYNFQTYENDIYGYYIHPNWDYLGSETLYCKILWTDYDLKFTVIEIFGEWNDTLHNDIMHLKRNVIDPQLAEGIVHFILVGENVLNFHGSRDDDYYAEWFEETTEGWITAINFRDFVEVEFTKYKLDYYLNFGGTLHDIPYWRTLKPTVLFEGLNQLIRRRLQ